MRSPPRADAWRFGLGQRPGDCFEVTLPTSNVFLKRARRLVDRAARQHALVGAPFRSLTAGREWLIEIADVMSGCRLRTKNDRPKRFSRSAIGASIRLHTAGDASGRRLELLKTRGRRDRLDQRAGPPRTPDDVDRYRQERVWRGGKPKRRSKWQQAPPPGAKRDDRDGGR